MNCDEARDLAAAYAFDALDAVERAAVEAHLASCSNPHEEFAEARAVALGLAAEAPERTPSAGLRERILRGVAAEASSRAVGRWRALTGLAAAIAVLALAVAGWTLATGPGEAPRAQVHVYETADGQWLRVEALDHRAAVELGGLPPVADEAYQVWIVRDGAPISLQVFEADTEGPWSGTSSLEVRTGDVLAVTREPSGGSPGPTSAPLMQTEF